MNRRGPSRQGGGGGIPLCDPAAAAVLALLLLIISWKKATKVTETFTVYDRLLWVTAVCQALSLTPAVAELAFLASPGG